MIPFHERAKTYSHDAARLEALKPDALRVFDDCRTFIQQARDKGEETLIFRAPLLSRRDYHFVDITPDTQVAVELHQRGPRSRPVEVILSVNTPVREEPYETYSEHYKILITGKVQFSRDGVKFKDLSPANLEERMPLLVEASSAIVRITATAEH